MARRGRARSFCPKDWSPITTYTQTLIANIGDENPLEYGGHLIYLVRDPDYTEYRSIYFDEPQDGKYVVFRWAVEKDVLKDLSWLDEENIRKLADVVDLTVDDLERESVDPDVKIRAGLYGDVGRYWGFENLDAYPEQYTEKQMKRYFPELWS